MEQWNLGQSLEMIILKSLNDVYDVKSRKSEIETVPRVSFQLSLNLHIHRKRLEGNIPNC